MKVSLLFPPGWTLCTGSPHLAIPLLSSFVASQGIDITCNDLNHLAASQFTNSPTAADTISSCAKPTLDSLNEPFFSFEDQLMDIARRYNAEWNAQLGFQYQDRREVSSFRCFQGLKDASPFSSLFENSIVPGILREAPAILGLSIASSLQLPIALQLVFLLRNCGFDGCIVLGGNTITRLLKELSIPWVFDLVDGLVPYQGETALLQLCRALEIKNTLANVPELVWRDNDGHIRQNEAGPSLNLSSAPVPDYRPFALGNYAGVNYLNIVGVRGCYYGKCSFCAIPYGWSQTGFAGSHTADHVVKDMLTLISRHGINRFKFVDEALSPALIGSFANYIISSDISVEWEAYCRLESQWELDSFVRRAARAGCRKVYFGLEFLPSESRSGLKKNDCARPDTVLKVCAANGIKVHFFCMFGFPGSGEEDAARTTEFILDHLEQIDTVDIFPWGYAKHTSIPGVTPTRNPNDDWALEFEYTTERSDVLLADEVNDLAARYEEMIWEAAPRLLHPTYRLVSPWSIEQGRQDSGIDALCPQQPSL